MIRDTVDSTIHLAQGHTGDLADFVEEARNGNPEAADRLFGEIRPRLIRIALAMGIDPDAASDTVQDTLLAAHRDLDRFDHLKGSFEGWMSKALVNRVRNRRRSLGRKRRLLAAFRAAAARATAGGQREVEARLTLKRLLTGLSHRQREVVALYEIGGLGSDEVARILDMTPAGVRSTARDARRRLEAAAENHELTQEAGR